MNQRVADSYLINTLELSMFKVVAIFDNFDHVISGIGIRGINFPLFFRNGKTKIKTEMQQDFSVFVTYLCLCVI